MTFTLYGCGSNGQYQLGNGGNDDASDLQPAIFSGGEGPTSKPVEIVGGGNHTLVRMASGEVYAAGDNTEGQCGLPRSEKHLKVFTRLSLPPAIVGIAAGWEFSVVATATTVYVCGRGLKGELGLGNKRLRTNGGDDPWEALRFTFPAPIVSVTSSLSHTVVVLANHQLYGWGNGRRGQLGTAEVHWEPTIVATVVERPLAVALGREFTLVSDGKHSEYLGRDSFAIRVAVREVGVHKRVFSMWSSLHFWGDTLHSVGNNSHGQRFPGSPSLPLEVAVGSEHGLVRFDGSRVWAWGWGEHGNCGRHPSGDDSVTFPLLTLLHEFSGEQIVSLAGGCATSWVVTQRL